MLIYIAGDCDMAPEHRPGLWAVFELDRGGSVDALFDAMDDMAYIWVETPPPAGLDVQPGWFIYHIRKTTSLAALAPRGDLIINRLGDP